MSNGKMKPLDWVAYLLLMLGGLNWGFVGAFRINLVELILGGVPAVVHLVYILVGLAALYSLVMVAQKQK